MKNILSAFVIIVAVSAIGCNKMLNTKVYGEFSPDNVLKTEAGMKALLISSYAASQPSTPSRFIINDNEYCTDLGYNTGGNENQQFSVIINFTWDASLGTFRVDLWNPNYNSIRDANILLANVDDASMSDASKKLFAAEARFLRAFAYDNLFKYFGPVPLRKSPNDPKDLNKPSEDTIKNFIESELLAAIPDLPDPGKEDVFGRANKGMAASVLAKFYLQTRQWQKAADACNQVMNFNYYQLFPSYKDMFRVENEKNREMILVVPCLNENGFGNWYTAGALPPAFKSTPQIPEYVWVPGMANFATQYRLRSAFVNSFDLVNDKRAILVIRTYVNQSNATVNLMSTPDNARSLKYWDNATVGNHSGNDWPVIRYADILLSRAEALNEINGPTQDALDLINLIRTRAGISNLTLVNAATKEVLRSLILQERAWEFYTEGKRREDLLRNGTFISGALARGITGAEEKHKLFPIPQAELDANKALVQNAGY